MAIQKLMHSLRGIKISKTLQSEEGKIGYILAWLVGIPIPILVFIFLLRGCN